MYGAIVRMCSECGLACAVRPSGVPKSTQTITPIEDSLEKLDTWLMLERLAYIPRNRNDTTATYNMLELKEAINALIKNACKEARIDELENITDGQIDLQELQKLANGLTSDVVPAMYIYDRIEALHHRSEGTQSESELEGNK
jgi:hypothetical protein